MRVQEDVIVRPEIPNELPVIRCVNEAAFGQHEEADLVDNLRSAGVVLVSLVAEVNTRIVGHILFSRMSVETADGSIPAAALAPLAVLPEHQRRRIGERLIRKGLNMLREQGEHIVIVVGHPDYYPRFGFSAEKARFLESLSRPKLSWVLNSVPALLMAFTEVRHPGAFAF